MTSVLGWHNGAPHDKEPDGTAEAAPLHQSSPPKHPSSEDFGWVDFLSFSTFAQARTLLWYYPFENKRLTPGTQTGAAESMSGVGKLAALQGIRTGRGCEKRSAVGWKIL